MGPILSSLIDLQAIETKIRKTKKELKKGQEVINKQRRRIEQLQAAIIAKHEEIKLSRIQNDKLELDLKMRDESIARMRVALNSAKTNKEYSAVLTKINTDKANNAKLEDQILALITQIDNDKTACTEIEENIEVETRRLEDISGEVESRQEAIKAKLRELVLQRREAYEKVSLKSRNLFDRLAERYDGEVLAAVDQMNGPKGVYSCGGCYMKVPLEVVNSLMSRDEMVICSNCGRILVLDMNPKQQATS